MKAAQHLEFRGDYLYVGSSDEVHAQVLRYNAITGAFVDVFVDGLGAYRFPPSQVGPSGPPGPQGPPGSQVWSTYLPLLVSDYVASTFTPGSNITLTRIQGRAAAGPSRCRTNAVVQVSDGTISGTVTLTISAIVSDSGIIGINYAAGTPITISIVTPATGCSVTPLSVNFVAQYSAR